MLFYLPQSNYGKLWAILTEIYHRNSVGFLEQRKNKRMVTHLAYRNSFPALKK